MAEEQPKDKCESGLPGGGAGRKDEVGKSGVYPMSGPHPAGDAPLVGLAGWGQGQRGPAGYEDHGESAISFQPVTPERCADIMTKDPVCCSPGATTQKAAELMLVHDVGMVPVVASIDDKRLVGVVTDRDLVIRVLADDLDPGRMRVESVMSHRPFTCSPDDPWPKALEVMEQRQIRRVPIVDRTGMVVGIVSQADVALRVPDKKQTAELVERISQRAA